MPKVYDKWLLLGPLEVGATGDQLDQHLVKAAPALLGDAGDVGVELGGHPQDNVAAVGLLAHVDNSTASGTMRSSQKQGSRRANAQPSYSRRCIR
jgi:hypothetical protein